MTVFWFLNNFPLRYNIEFYNMDTLEYSERNCYHIKCQSIFSGFEKPEGFDDFIKNFGDFHVVDTDLCGDTLMMYISNDYDKLNSEYKTLQEMIEPIVTM